VRRSDMGRGMVAAGEAPAAATSSRAPSAQPTLRLSSAQLARFHALYRDGFDFVFRNLQRLGVPPAQVDDAVQEVFVVVARHIDDYVEGTHSRAWLFAIVARVAGNQRRSQRRRAALQALARQQSTLHGADPEAPFEHAARAEASAQLFAALATLDEDKRNLIVLSELEQMSVPEIAHAFDQNVNTVYARVRAARRALADAMRQQRGAGEP